MKSLELNQMEEINGGGWLECLVGIVAGGAAGGLSGGLIGAALGAAAGGLGAC